MEGRGAPHQRAARNGLPGGLPGWGRWRIGLEVQDVLGAAQGEEEEEVVAEVPGDEEVLPHVLAAVLPQPPGILGIGQELLYGVGSALNAVGEEPGELVLYLKGYPAHGRGHHRLPLPQGLTHREAKALL